MVDIPTTTAPPITYAHYDFFPMPSNSPPPDDDRMAD